MFSGIVEQIGQVESIQNRNGTLRLQILAPFSHLETGESVSVDGVCLTVVSFTGAGFACDVSPETQNLTLAAHYQIGTVVNLERALRVGDRLGGHWVTGHVDTTLRVSHIEDRSDCRWVHFEGVESADRGLLARKGCVTLNGVSLTVNEVGLSFFSVLLVPHTLAHTNLKDLKISDPVNIEWDWMAKTVREALQNFLPEKNDGTLPY